MDVSCRYEVGEGYGFLTDGCDGESSCCEAADESEVSDLLLESLYLYMISTPPASFHLGPRTASSSSKAPDSSGCKNGDAAFFSWSPVLSIDAVESFAACPF
jgi:hypothetical protein